MESAEATCLHVQNGPRLCNAQRLAACKRNIIFTTPVLQKHHKTGQDNLGVVPGHDRHQGKCNESETKENSAIFLLDRG
eukprot:scaffold227965_cov17-Tisochrysis_lutea.AAC.1